MTATRWQKRLELGLLALIVAVAAGVIWTVIQLAFPRGSSLQELGARPADDAAGSMADIAAVPGVALVRFEGLIAALSNRVQMRSGGELAWSDARVGRTLHTQDGVQTHDGASALIGIKGQGDITIGENSLVVFEQNTTDPFLATQLAVAVVDRGELSGSLAADTDGDALGIRLPNGAVRVQGARAGETADFRLQVNGDRSASVVILRGQAQVHSRAGNRKLGVGEALRISADGRTLETQSMPPVPRPVEPATGQVVVYRKDHPSIAFRWDSAAPVDGYRFLLAGDADFRSVLADEHLTADSYTQPDLGTGTYYWKVSSRRGWLESPPTTAAALHVERELDGEVRAALADLYRQQEAAQRLAGQAQGVLVFPRVIKGGLIVGGEYGEGALLARGRTVGYFSLKSASLGLQLGAQTRSVVLLFMTPEIYTRFVDSNGWKVGVDGNVALVVLGSGGATTTGSGEDPIKGFVYSNKGLMYNLTLEGSKITRLPD